MRARSNDPLDAHVPERTCILSRRTAPREELIQRHLMTVHLGCYASPTYIKRHGIPKTPDELDQLVSGQATMGGLLRVALIRAIERLEIEVAWCEALLSRSSAVPPG